MRRHARLACALATALVLPLVVHAQVPGMARGNPTFKPGPGPDELWETTMKMEVAGMTMGGDTQQVCIRKGRSEADLVPKSDECTVTDVRTTGNRTTFAMACKGDPPMSGTGDITATATANSGRITMRSTRRGEEMTMVQTFNSKRIGTCTDQSQQMVAKAEADSRAMVAKSCAEGMDLLEPTLFEGSQPCAAQRKAFCDRVGAVAGTMREPAGHAEARRRHANTLQRALQACGQDYAAVSRVACAKAVETRNWTFVGGGACDGDVRAHAPTYCTSGPNRSPDPQYFALCSRYVTLTRGTGTADAGGAGGSAGPGTAAAAPKPAAPDPVKSGVDAVRRLLPF